MEVRQALRKFREVFLGEKMQKLYLSQLGIEEKLVQLSRYPLVSYYGQFLVLSTCNFYVLTCFIDTFL